MDSRGYVAPPTVWPLDLALAPPGIVGEGRASLAKTTAPGALWLPGWGTFRSPSIAAGGPATTASAMSSPAGGGEDDQWPWLGVLTAMSARAEDSTPFLRLGGSPHTDMSNVCHEVSRASRRGSSSSGSRFDKSGNSAASAGGQGATLWRGQQKALVEAALDEGVRMVHVPGLEGSSSSGTGAGTGSGVGSGSASGGSGGGGGASWPGPAGYSFACWLRFNPPTGAGGASGASEVRGDGGGSYGNEPPEDMKAWREDEQKAMKTAVAIAKALSGTDGSSGGGKATDTMANQRDMGAGGEDELAGDDVEVSEDRVSPGSGRGSGGTATDGGVERGESVDSTRVDGGGSVPRPHVPGRQVCVSASCVCVCGAKCAWSLPHPGPCAMRV